MAGRIALNLKDFEYLKHDQHSTTLKHKSGGHILKIAHKSLSKDGQEQLAALHKGVDEQAPKTKRIVNTDALSKLAPVAQTTVQSAETQLADGGDVKEQPKQTPEEQWQQVKQGKSNQEYAQDVSKGSQQGQSLSEGWKNLKSELGFAEGGEAEKPQKQEPEKQPENTLDYKKLVKEKKQMNVAEARQPVQGRRMYADGTPDQPVQPESADQPNAPNIPPEWMVNTQNDPVAGKASSQITGGSDPSQVAEKYNQLIDNQAMLHTINPLTPTPSQDDVNSLKFGGDGSEPSQFDPNTWVQAKNEVTNERNALKQQDIANAQNVTRVNEVRKEAGLPPLPNLELPQNTQDNLAEAQSAPQQEVPQRSPQSMPQGAPSPAGARGPGGMPQSFEDLGNMLYGGYGKQLTGIQQKAQAEEQIGKEQGAALDAQVDNQQKALGAYQKEVSDLNAERAGFINDLKNQHIDPNAYWKDHSKLMTGIGLILGGMGSGLTGGPNQAMQMLQYQMNNNMKAQQAEMDKKNNLLKFNYMQYGNMKDALDATRIMQNDIVVHQLQAAAAHAATPMAKANANMASGQLEQQTAQLMQPFIMRRMMMNLVGNGEHGAAQQTLQYLRVMNPELYKDYASRYIPGYNKFADIPIDDKARQEIISKDSLAAGLKDLIGFAKQHAGSFDPQTVAAGRAKAMYLQQLLREGLGMGVYREYDQPLMNKMAIEDPTKLLTNITGIPKLKALLQQNDLSRRVLLSRYGLPFMPADSSTDPRAMLQWAMKNPKDPRAVQIMQNFKQQAQQ